ncbi:hypothetical protein BDN72DRAFT_591162 [Pluteus cervinus]|uniref:Uncharacterized protein n=1 Tax=Pluteus cervinus TaxID=181527 RepID=A0ACD3AWE4_9AGAR|nr:hypothetical protein BDN72DRAFT_591162 [Pluteus cervinus]
MLDLGTQGSLDGAVRSNCLMESCNTRWPSIADSRVLDVQCTRLRWQYWTYNTQAWCS